MSYFFGTDHSLNCPVCLEQFDRVERRPKTFLTCGHCVCQQCLPGCTERGRAKCPVCRQETEVPANGLPTNYKLEAMVSEVDRFLGKDAINCSECARKIPVSDAFVCVTCSPEKEHAVCGSCCVRAHRSHNVVDKRDLASDDEVAAIRSKIARQKDAVDELVKKVTDELDGLNRALQPFVQDCKFKQRELEAGLDGRFTTKAALETVADQSEEFTNATKITLNKAFAAIHKGKLELETLLHKPAEKSKCSFTESMLPADSVKEQESNAPTLKFDDVAGSAVPHRNKQRRKRVGKNGQSS